MPPRSAQSASSPSTVFGPTVTLASRPRGTTLSPPALIMDMRSSARMPSSSASSGSTTGQAKMAPVFEFDDVRVEPKAFRVLKAGGPVPLEPKAFDLLAFLIENRGRLVEKHELLAAVWKETVVSENAMTRVVAQLR